MSYISLTRACNFYKTKKNINSWRERSVTRKLLMFEKYKRAEGPCQQSMAMTDLEIASYTCTPIIPVGGCLIGSLFEGTGAIIDGLITYLTFKNCNAQNIDDIDEADEGSGCFQGCLGFTGNLLGTCVGGLFACAPCILAFTICLPKNCCVHYCCPPTEEEIQAKEDLLAKHYNKVLDDLVGPATAARAASEAMEYL